MARQRILWVVTVVAALAAATPALAQRMSLGERVTLLENQANAQNQGAGQANLETLNRMEQLQAEVQALRNTVETLQNEIEQLKQRNREQYVDLDGRLGRLEGRPAGDAATPDSAAAPAAPAPRAAAPAAGQGFEDVSEPAAPAAVAAAAAAGSEAPQVSTADPALEEPNYQAALDALVERFEAAESARLFQAFLRDYPASPLVPNAYYWLGESYYVTQNYDLALDAFQTLLAQHPGSRKEADALLKLGYSQIALGQRDAGEASLRDVTARYAGTDAAAKAESRLRTLALETR
jgi:tol-pal system protein YbgF